MAVIATDILLKSMIEAAIADLRANNWILEDIFAGLAADPMAAPEAGWKEVQAAINWFLKTDIPVLLQHRIADTPKIPCISIAYKPSREMEDRASIGDDGSIDDYPLDGNGKGTLAVIKITGNFTPDKYDRSKGIITFPKGFDTDSMSVGNYIVSKHGKAFSVLGILSGTEFQIEAGVTEDFTDAYIAPKSNVWSVHREQTFISESYDIGCHTQNDPATTIWLWQLIFYSCLRYKEAFLEGRCFELSGLSSSALERNPEFQSENVYSKYITITGQTEVNWIKFIAPKFESVTAQVQIADSNPAVDLDTVYGDDSEECPPAWSTGDDFVEDEFEIELDDDT